MTTETTHIYAGAARSGRTTRGGLFRRGPGAGEWEAIVKGLPERTDVQSITVHPQDPKLMYLGTRSGPYRSTDGGESWQRLSFPEGLEVWAIQVHPTKPRTLYLGTAPVGVYRSDDGGDTWRHLACHHRPERVKMELPLPHHAAGRGPEPPDEIYAAVEVGGVIRSLDGGETWSDCSDDLVKLAERPHLKSRIQSDTEIEGMMDGHALCVSGARRARCSSPCAWACSGARPGQDLGRHGSGPVLAADLRARRARVAARSAAALRLPEPGRAERGRLALPEHGPRPDLAAARPRHQGEQHDDGPGAPSRRSRAGATARAASARCSAPRTAGRRGTSTRCPRASRTCTRWPAPDPAILGRAAAPAGPPPPNRPSVSRLRHAPHATPLPRAPILRSPCCPVPALQTDELCPCNWRAGEPTLQVARSLRRAASDVPLDASRRSFELECGPDHARAAREAVRLRTSHRQGRPMKFGIGQSVARFEDPRARPRRGPLPRRHGAAGADVDGGGALAPRARADPRHRHRRGAPGARRDRGVHRRRSRPGQARHDADDAAAQASGRLADVRAAPPRPHRGPRPLRGRSRGPRHRADARPGRGRGRPGRRGLRAAAVGDAHRRRRSSRAAPRCGTSARTTCPTSSRPATRPRPTRRSRGPIAWSGAATSSPASTPSTWSPAAPWASTTPARTATRSTRTCSTPTACVRALATNIFKVPEHQVRVIARRRGRRLRHQGLAVPEHRLVLWAARKVKRPVRWACERREAIPSDEHARDNVSDAELALDADGRFLAIRVRTLANVGAYVSSDRNLLATFSNVVTLAGVYAFPAAYVHVTLRHDEHERHRAVPGRGPARGDVRARAADRRRRARAGPRPGRAPADEPHPRLRDAVEEPARRHLRLRRLRDEHGQGAQARRRGGLRGAARGVREARQAPRHRRRQRHRARGRARSPSSPRSASARAAAPPCSWAPRTRARATRPRSSRSSTSASAWTPPQVRYIDGDTDRVGFGMGSMGSRSTVIGGTALWTAADKVIAKGKKIAARLLEAAEADIGFADGPLHRGRHRSRGDHHPGREGHVGDEPAPPGLEPGLAI